MDILTLDISQLGFAAFGLIVWFLRLEGTVKALKRENQLLEKRIDDLHGDHKALSEKVVNDLGMVKEALARIEAVISERVGK